MRYDDDDLLSIFGAYAQEYPVKVEHLANLVGAVVRRRGRLGALSTTSGRIERERGFFHGVTKTSISVFVGESFARQRLTVAVGIAHILLHKPMLPDRLKLSVLYRTGCLTEAQDDAAKILGERLIAPMSLIEKAMVGLERAIPSDQIKLLASRLLVPEPVIVRALQR